MNRIYWLLLLLFVTCVAHAQQPDYESLDPKKATPEQLRQMFEYFDRQANQYLSKTSGDPSSLKSLIIKGNKITTVVYNNGNITKPNTLANVADLVWNRIGYGFEFTPLVAAEVVDANGKTVHILDEGMTSSSEGAYGPDGLKWGWLPKPGFSAPGQPDIAAWSARKDVNGDLTRKPHSWPESWYNPILGRYVWPAFLGNDATTPDEEVYFVADDNTNKKQEYYPFPNDSTRRGLGLDIECRFFQFNNPLAEDIIFLVYRVTNRSPKTINKVYFGMYGDPHIGGSGDYNDDLAFFIPPSGPLADPFPQRARSMVYAWDSDMKGVGGLVPGYFGFKFLESPTNSENGIDDDDDGIIDESPFNDAGVYIDGVNLPLNTGIADTDKYIKVYGKPKPRWSGDENGNWDPQRDDVGIDGLPGTGDFGEGNGKPDIGYDANGNLVSEPNFGIRDVNESDQIGLTTFYALHYETTNAPKNDQLYWQLLSSDSIAIDQQFFATPGDNIFVYGSGPFALAPGATQRFSIALMMGESLPDLILNSETAQRILEANYLFAQPPPKPTVRAVPGDGKVTLYWDNVAEPAVDPLTNTKDFEGYRIYRSEDYTFSDIYNITDANGTPFLASPFLQNGQPAQFDVINNWSGLHPVEYQGRGVKYNLGKNTGLVHEYVDSSVTNGKTYYYAVASYDHGFDSLGIHLPPTESQIAITRDPVTGVLTFDQNTVAVTPGPPPSGTIPAMTDHGYAKRTVGNSTGDVSIQILDNREVLDNIVYNIGFRQVNGKIGYDVLSGRTITDNIISRDTLFVPLTYRNILPSSVTVKSASGTIVPPTSYILDPDAGRIRGVSSGALQAGASYILQYQYYPVYGSTHVNNEDDNTAFDGMRVFAQDQPLGIDSANSGWVMKNNTNLKAVVSASVSLPPPTFPFRPAPIDFEIRWNKTDTTANGKWLYPGDTLFNNANKRVVVCPFRIVNMTDSASIQAVVYGAADSIWRPGREITFLTPRKYWTGSGYATMSAVKFLAPNNGTPTILPTENNVYVVRTTKPFAAGDQYQFSTVASRFDVQSARKDLDRICVVPNPYVAYSALEIPGATGTQRGENRLQFRNLPPLCTIRIYTAVGELVDTIVKESDASYVNWNILSNEGQRLAYGVYIYHVDVPGVGEKIGRFALIK